MNRTINMIRLHVKKGSTNVDTMYLKALAYEMHAQATKQVVNENTVPIGSVFYNRLLALLERLEDQKLLAKFEAKELKEAWTMMIYLAWLGASHLPEEQKMLLMKDVLELFGRIWDAAIPIIE